MNNKIEDKATEVKDMTVNAATQEIGRAHV